VTRRTAGVVPRAVDKTPRRDTPHGIHIQVHHLILAIYKTMCYTGHLLADCVLAPVCLIKLEDMNMRYYDED